MNASQKRLFEEARKRNPDLKMPSETKPSNWSEADLQLVKQGVVEASQPGIFSDITISNLSASVPSYGS